jgi:hypothetical protein
VAILAFAFPFFPGALGSDFTSFTFKLSAVDDVVWNSSEGPRGAAEDATLRVASEEGPVEKAVTPSMMATTSKTAAMILLFMVVDLWCCVMIDYLPTDFLLLCCRGGGVWWWNWNVEGVTKS